MNFQLILVIFLNFRLSYYGLCLAEISSIFEDKFIRELEKSILSVDRGIQADQIRIVKRSVITSNGFELTKNFSNVPRDINNFSCIITVRIQSRPDLINTNLNINEDLSQLTVSAINYQIIALSGVTQSSSVLNNPSSSVSFPFTYNGNNYFAAQYSFKTSKIDSSFSRTISVSGSQSVLISASGCINPASFSENAAIYPLIALFILLGILIGLLVLVILYLVHRFRNQSKTDSVGKSRETDKMETRFLLLSDSQVRIDAYNSSTNERSFLNIIIEKDPRIIELELYQLRISNAVRSDSKMKSGFKELHRTIFQLWISNINSKFPSLKSKTDILRTKVNGLEDEISKKYQNINGENSKRLTKESVLINKMNLDHLKIKQETERQNTLQYVRFGDQEQVEDSMNKIFDQELDDLITQLKIHEDLSFEKDKEVQNQNVVSEINDIYVTNVREMILNNLLDDTSSPNDLNDIFRFYFDLLQNIQFMKEMERIRQMSRLEHLFQLRSNLVREKEIELRNFLEIFEKKSEHFTDVISDLNDEQEIRYTTGVSILENFKKYKENLLSEMEKLKEKQINNLLCTSNEARKKKINELMVQHASEVSNLLENLKFGGNSKLLLENLATLEMQYYVNVKNEELFYDTEGTNELLKIYNEIDSETIDKLEDQVLQLTNELKSEGIEVESILDDLRRKSKKIITVLDSEKGSQLKIMKENLKKSKEKIDKNEDTQINELKKQFVSENKIIDDLLSIQKALSNDDRYTILNDCSRNILCLQNSVAHGYLEERQKLEQSIAFNKAKKVKEMEEKHEETIKVMFSKRLKSNTQKSEEDMRIECLKILTPEYIKNKLQFFMSAGWRNDTDKEIQAIRNEILSMRALLLHQKKEETVAFVIRLQLLKSKERFELKELEEKIKNIQLATLKSNDQIAEDVFKSYQQKKDTLEEEFLKSKLLQERNFQKKSENRKRGGLLSTVTEQQAIEEDNSVMKQRQQAFASQVLRNDKQFEIAFCNMEKELLKQFLSTGNLSNDDILGLMLEVYPIKFKSEIDELLKELYTNKPKQNQDTNSDAKKSLLEEYKKYTEIREERPKESPKDVSVILRKMDTKESLTNVDNDSSVKLQEFNNQEENVPVKTRRKKKKVRQKQIIDDADFNDDF